MTGRAKYLDSESLEKLVRCWVYCGLDKYCNNLKEQFKGDKDGYIKALKDEYCVARFVDDLTQEIYKLKK